MPFFPESGAGGGGPTAGTGLASTLCSSGLIELEAAFEVEEALSSSLAALVPAGAGVGFSAGVSVLVCSSAGLADFFPFFFFFFFFLAFSESSGQSVQRHLTLRERD